MKANLKWRIKASLSRGKRALKTRLKKTPPHTKKQQEELVGNREESRRSDIYSNEGKGLGEGSKTENERDLIAGGEENAADKSMSLDEMMAEGYDGSATSASATVGVTPRSLFL
ncbi:MAG: hypothetical protein M1834_001388 [Cirrosporium novae-zelandiae]|nr:MAG: hypothetical protein M1834_001388 [Cirrosporium novae-zelandiae]